MAVFEITEKRVEEVKAYADGLRQIADFVERNPHLPLPERDISIYSCEVDDKATLAAYATAFGGCRKEFAENTFTLSRLFGAVNLRVVAMRRTVCKRVTETVAVEEEVPVEFEERLESVATKFEKRTVTKEVTRWDCGEPLLSTNNSLSKA